MKRICIYTKDIQMITGRSERHSRTIISNIRDAYEKEKHQPITIYEFCQYMDFDVEKVAPLLK
jgi:ribosomal silencing factor RsfS